MINGTVKGKVSRKEIREKFQEDNDDLIVIIGHPKICTGGSYGDHRGNRPRISFITPRNRATDNYQAEGRISRADTMSHNYSIFVFFDGIPTENKKLESYQRNMDELHISIGKKYEIDYPKQVVRDVLGPFEPSLAGAAACGGVSAAPGQAAHPI